MRTSSAGRGRTVIRGGYTWTRTASVRADHRLIWTSDRRHRTWRRSGLYTSDPYMASRAPPVAPEPFVWLRRSRPARRGRPGRPRRERPRSWCDRGVALARSSRVGRRYRGQRGSSTAPHRRTPRKRRRPMAAWSVPATSAGHSLPSTTYRYPSPAANTTSDLPSASTSARAGSPTCAPTVRLQSRRLGASARPSSA
jgi:hypothetical protein